LYTLYIEVFTDSYVNLSLVVETANKCPIIWT